MLYGVLGTECRYVGERLGQIQGRSIGQVTGKTGQTG